MKTLPFKIVPALLITLSIVACQKSEYANAEIAAEPQSSFMKEAVSDSISYAATQEIPDKKFVKTAEVNMEVKDVYDATIAIEKKLQEFGGFVTSSNLYSRVVSEDSYNKSDDEVILVRKFRVENRMQIRVPSQKLGEFLQIVSDKKLFLNSRIINAEDVTANIKFAELESQRIRKTGDNITSIKNDEKKVNLADGNMSEENQQKLAAINMSDNLRYSTVNIYIEEPKLSISTIAIPNTKSFDNQYKYNFFYDAKNAVIDGFYMVQRLLIGLLNIWPLVLIGGIVIYFFRKRKTGIKNIEAPEVK